MHFQPRSPCSCWEDFKFVLICSARNSAAQTRNFWRINLRTALIWCFLWPLWRKMRGCWWNWLRKWDLRGKGKGGNSTEELWGDIWWIKSTRAFKTWEDGGQWMLWGINNLKTNKWEGFVRWTCWIKMWMRPSNWDRVGDELGGS